MAVPFFPHCPSLCVMSSDQGEGLAMSTDTGPVSLVMALGGSQSVVSVTGQLGWKVCR
jgi:hypothetical protein